ncbi:tumor protein p53-inducible protein 13 isoform X2 [Gopherus flavomarginatus]|uniref:tumor protein p53-inducible protein 13 isoform X2 n=1 Tax=Gopherus flavomarginatus TaxID=286002 RepID=UPI0021CBD6B1|nr:tumor protein p53-inducible protein 13 isoform X2 [Gopherus flavomarginatus]
MHPPQPPGLAHPAGPVHPDPPQQPHAGVEEAAWAASALTFLLVVLTLAVLYTRLHRKFHKNQSLYWAPSDAGQEPLAAILKRWLLLAHGRHKKRQRPQQRRLLLQGPSSESSD